MKQTSTILRDSTQFLFDIGRNLLTQKKKFMEFIKATRIKREVLRLLRKLPGSSVRFGPPRGFTAETPGWVYKWNLEEGFPKASCEYTQLASRILRIKPATLYGLNSWQYHAWDMSCEKTSPKTEPPRTFFATIPNARVFGDDGCIIAPNDNVLGDVSLDINVVIEDNPESNHVFRQIKLPPVRHLSGNTAVLTSLGGHNYFHWMFHVLPRLALMKHVGIDLDQVDWFFINKISSPFQVETLKAFGIETERVIGCCKNTHIQVDRLLLPSRPSRMSEMPQWSCDFLRKEFLPKESTLRGQANYHERLYVSRSKAAHRNVINEQEVEEYLHALGFQSVILETMTVSEQALAFNQAKVIVAPHGAGLTNLVFCCPGTVVIEIFSPSYINGCYWVLSNWIGARYYFILGKGRRERDDLFALGENIETGIDDLIATFQLAGLIKN